MPTHRHKEAASPKLTVPSLGVALFSQRNNTTPCVDVASSYNPRRARPLCALDPPPRSKHSCKEPLRARPNKRMGLFRELDLNATGVRVIVQDVSYAVPSFQVRTSCRCPAKTVPSINERNQRGGYRRRRVACTSASRYYTHRCSESWEVMALASSAASIRGGLSRPPSGATATAFAS